ncbi:MAG TPA: hypothetical protein VIK14_18130 [Ignavibacteria bacterium]
MKQKIRIAAGQGFWRDLIDAPYKQATGRRPKPSEVIAYWPCLISKSKVDYKVLVEEL